MRLTRIDWLPALKGVWDWVRPVLDPVLARARAELDRLVPHRDRLSDALRKHPKLAAGIGVVAGGWRRLVETFCAMIDPYLGRFFIERRLVAVVAASGDVELHKILKGAATSVGLLAALDASTRAEIAKSKWTAIELRLRPDQLLQRTLSLPAASRDFLGSIIEHRLERLTPWRSDRVLYGYSTLHGPELGGGVGVALTATSKDVVAPPLRALGAADLVPTAIGALEDGLDKPLRVNLFHGTESTPRVDSRRMVSRTALAVFASLAIVYLGTSLWAAAAVEGQQEAAVRLLKARRLLKAASMGNIGERERELLDAKQPGKAMVVLIDKLAKAVPQDTYLKELAVTSDQVRLVGSSANAPALVGELEATGLGNVRFISAVTREKDQRDSFEITADRVAPALTEAP